MVLGAQWDSAESMKASNREAVNDCGSVEEMKQAIERDGRGRWGWGLGGGPYVPLPSAAAELHLMHAEQPPPLL